MHRGRRRSVARLLAPVALLAAGVAVLVVIQSTTDSNGSKNGTASKTTTEQGTTPDNPQKQRRVRPTYTVKLNDTLVLISEKTGVSVERIETLNPELDPQNLIVGQKIKLRE
jgi:LysM repeat protein